MSSYPSPYTGYPLAGSGAPTAATTANGTDDQQPGPPATSRHVSNASFGSTFAPLAAFGVTDVDDTIATRGSAQQSGQTTPPTHRTASNGSSSQRPYLQTPQTEAVPDFPNLDLDSYNPYRHEFLNAYQMINSPVGQNLFVLPSNSVALDANENWLRYQYQPEVQQQQQAQPEQQPALQSQESYGAQNQQQYTHPSSAYPLVDQTLFYSQLQQRLIQQLQAQLAQQQQQQQPQHAYPNYAAPNQSGQSSSVPQMSAEAMYGYQQHLNQMQQADYALQNQQHASHESINSIPALQPITSDPASSVQSTPSLQPSNSPSLDLALLSEKKKRARQPQTWKRNNYVRKVLKDKGPCKCLRQCYKLISPADKERIQQEFATLPKIRQDAQLLSCIQIESNATKQYADAKSHSGNGDGNSSQGGGDLSPDDRSASDSDTETQSSQTKRKVNKPYSTKYYVRIQDAYGSAESHDIRVCHHAFLSVHGIGKKRVHNLVQHAYSTGANVPKEDKRGKHNNRANRVSDDLVILAEQHINSFPRYKLKASVNFDPLQIFDSLSASSSLAHGKIKSEYYSSSDSLSQLPDQQHPVNPNRLPARFLSPNLSLTKMYRLFIAHYQPILLQIETRQPSLAKSHRPIKKMSKAGSSTLSAVFEQPTAEDGEESKSAVNDSFLPNMLPRALSNETSNQFNPSQPVQDPTLAQLLGEETAPAPEPVVSTNTNTSPFTFTTPSVELPPNQLAIGSATGAAPLDCEWQSIRSLDSDTLTRIVGALPCSLCMGQLQGLIAVSATFGASRKKTETEMQLLGVFCTANCADNFRARFKLLQNHGIDYRLTQSNTKLRGLPMPYSVDKTLKPIVSRDKYERLFRGMNLRFGSAKPESCPLCNEFTVRITNLTNSSSTVEKDSQLNQMQDAWHMHLARAKRAKDMLDHDKRLAIESWIKYRNIPQPILSSDHKVTQFAPATFDFVELSFQPNRPCPQFPQNALPSDSVLYRRQMWIYVYGIYSAVSNKVMPFMWSEQTARRGINEVLSCLWYYTMQQRSAQPRAPWLIAFGEGKLKSYWASCFFAELCREDSPYFSYRRIDYKVCEPGHAHMESDQPLAGLDKNERNIAVYSPKDWYDHAKTLSSERVRSDKQLQPHWLTRDHIFNWKQSLAPLYTKAYTGMDIEGRPIDLDRAVWFNFGCAKDNASPQHPTGGPIIYHPYEMWVRFSLDDQEPWTKVRIRKLQNLTTAQQTMTRESSTTPPSKHRRHSSGSPTQKPAPLVPLHPVDAPKLSLSAAKTSDLFYLRKHVPQQYQHLYPSKPTIDAHSTQVHDDKNTAHSIDTEEETEMSDDDKFLPPAAIQTSANREAAQSATNRLVADQSTIYRQLNAQDANHSAITQPLNLSMFQPPNSAPGTPQSQKRTNGVSLPPLQATQQPRVPIQDQFSQMHMQQPRR